MQAKQYIAVDEFMQHLRANGLVIVRGDELVNVEQARLQALRKKLMRLPAITFKQVIDAQLLPVSSKQSIQRWADENKFRQGEVFTDSKGLRKILTSAIVRLGYYNE